MATSDQGLESNDEMDSLVATLEDTEDEMESLPEDTAATPEIPDNLKDGVNILVVGHTGAGKSSLINALFGAKVAKVTESVKSTDHESVECHLLEVNGKKIYIYDTRGFGDEDIKEDDSILQKIEETQSCFDLVLFCHELYGRVDRSTREEMKLLATKIKKEILEHTIFVFTFGDEYKIRYPEYRNRRQIPDAQEKIQTKMKERAEELSGELRKRLATVTTDTSVSDNIPYCIVSGVDTKLPTSHNWTDDLWKLCEERSSKDAKSLMTWYGKHHKKVKLAGSVLLGGIVAAAAIVTMGPAYPALSAAASAAASKVAAGRVASTIGVKVVSTTLTIGGGIWAAREFFTGSKTKSMEKKSNDEDKSMENKSNDEDKLMEDKLNDEDISKSIG